MNQESSAGERSISELFPEKIHAFADQKIIDLLISIDLALESAGNAVEEIASAKEKIRQMAEEDLERALQIVSEFRETLARLAHTFEEAKTTIAVLDRHIKSGS